MTTTPTSRPRCSIGLLLRDFKPGGTERVAIRLANAWSLMGCRVLMLVGNDEGPQRALLGDAVEVIPAGPPFVRGERDSLARLARWAASHISGMDAFYLPGNSYFAAIRPLSRTGIAIYTTITNPLWRPDRPLVRNLTFALLTRRQLRRTAGVISMSPALLRQDRAVTGSQTRMTVLPNAIFDSLPGHDAAARRPWRICTAARLVPQKNIALLLRSVALLRDLPVTLCIAGDGCLQADLQKLVSKLSLDSRVTFLGHVPDTTRVMAEAEVMVLTSGYEGYPAVAVEALAAGAFVITSNCSPGLADILTAPELGQIVREQTPAAFATALRQFFSGAVRTKTTERIAAARPLLQLHLAGVVARQQLRFMGIAATAPMPRIEPDNRDLAHEVSWCR